MPKIKKYLFLFIIIIANLTGICCVHKYIINNKKNNYLMLIRPRSHNDYYNYIKDIDIISKNHNIYMQTLELIIKLLKRSN